MAILSTVAGDELTRTPSWLDPSQDWTRAHWVRFSSEVTLPSYYANWYAFDFTPDTYALGGFAYKDTLVDPFVQDGESFLPSLTIGTSPIDAATWRYVAWRYTALNLEIELLIDGVVVDAFAADLSAAGATVNSEERLGYDGGSEPGIAFGYDRWWQAAVTDGELLVERTSPQAVRTANLLTDTPLSSPTDLGDISGNNRDWALTGTWGSIAGPTEVSPSNTSPYAATVIDPSSLPLTITQDAVNAGVTYNLWFSFTPTTSNVYGLSAFGALGGYRPRVRVWTGSPGSLTNVFIGSRNKPMQFWMESGTTYYLEMDTNSASVTPAILNLTVIAAPIDTVQAGDLCIIDDSDGFPLAIVSPTVDYEVRRFVQPFAASENGDALMNGAYLVQDSAPDDIVAYDASFLEVARNPLLGVQDFSLRANRTQNVFDVVRTSSPNSTLHTFGSDGIPTGETFTLTGLTDINGICTNPTRTILYWGNNTINGSSIRRWDLVNNVALTDLAASIGNLYFLTDLLGLEDDTVLAGYSRTANPVIVKHYAADGTVLGTYTGPSNITTPIRLAYALNSPTSFLVATHTALRQWRVQRVLTADMATVVDDVLHMEFETGVYQGTETATPLALLGASFSCPLFLSLIPTAALRLTQLPVEAAYDYAMLQPFISGAGRNWITPPPNPSVS